MRNKIITLIAALSTNLFVLGLSAQTCQMFFPDGVGTLREMKTFDKQGQLMGYNLQKVIGKSNSGSTVIINVRSTAFNAEYEEMNSGELSYRCEGEVFRFHMEDFNLPNAHSADMAVEISGNELIYPSGMRKGDRLPDATFSINVKRKESVLLSTTIRMENRIVEAMEDVKTDVGTFRCFKITYNTYAKVSMFTVKTHEIEWIAPGVGTVKSESYNKKGKLSGSSVLTRLVVDQT